jgi:hypothetical protein
MLTTIKRKHVNIVTLKGTGEDRSARDSHGLALHLVTLSIFGVDLVQMIPVKGYVKYFVVPGVILLSQREIIRIWLRLMLVKQKINNCRKLQSYLYFWSREFTTILRWDFKYT